MPKKIFFILLLLFGSTILPVHVHAQESAGKLKRQADYLFAKGDIYQALPYLERYCIKKPKDLKAISRLAGAYEQIRDYSKAATWYRKLYEADKENHKEALFNEGRMLKMSGAYDSAQKAFIEFRKKYKGFDTRRELKKQCDMELEGCQLHDSLIRVEQDVAIQLLDTSINKIYSEFSPYQINDSTFIYASLRTDKILSETDKIPGKQFYVARKYKGQWKGGFPFTQELGDFGENIGNGAYSPFMDRFYFTVCNNNLSGQQICNIYVSRKENEIWTKPQRLSGDINSTSYSSTHPAIASDPNNKSKEILYFISDRPGGVGKNDIWYCVYDKRKKSYSEAKNAGKKLNTPQNEFSLFVDHNNLKLYFASDGLPGFGGLDLFKTMGSKRSWTIPENLGIPFNSPADDLYFTQNSSTGEGFFVSNRPGGYSFGNFSCCDDIYSFKWRKNIKISVQGSVLALLPDSMPSTDLQINNPVVELYVYDHITNTPVLIRTDSLDSPDFKLELEQGELYNIMVKSDQFLNKSFAISTRDYYLSDTLQLDFKLEPVPEKAIVLENIYFDFDNFQLLPEVRDYLDNSLLKLLNDNPKVRIEIAAYTDSKGDVNYNNKLSQKRADAVRDYLLEKGIHPKRIVARGFGEKNPIAPNQKPDGTDNPEGRQKNRRVEFKILK